MASTGAGDIAHVYLLELGPSIQHEEVEFITYDDATQQLLVVKGRHVFAYDVSKGPAGDSSLKWMYPLQVRDWHVGICCCMRAFSGVVSSCCMPRQQPRVDVPAAGEGLACGHLLLYEGI
jgi:hypothetical protein